MTLPLETRPEGLVLTVTAQPGSRRNEVRRDRDGSIKVSVTQIPERGKANKVVIEYLAEYLGLRKSQLELIAGETSRRKRILLRDVDEARLSAILAVIRE
ncbi:MAG TPA: DUF167 domain-containing protein [Planctomycetaceae bacterium]|nr:DUF167 domain-containing protein [Planctomycetaceae bacterium]